MDRRMIVDETPLFVPVAAASARSRLRPSVIEGCATSDPLCEDGGVIRCVRGASGRLLVHIPDVMLMAGALEDSGLMEKYGIPALGDG